MAEDATTDAITIEVNGTDGYELSDLDDAKVSGSYEYYYDTEDGYYNNGVWNDGDMPEDVVDSSIRADVKSLNDSEITAKYWLFYIKVGKLNFSKEFKHCDKDGKNCKTGTVTATVKVNQWLRSACVDHQNSNTNPSLLPTTFTLKVEDGQILVKYNSTEPVATQFAAGGFKAKKIAYKLKIQKKIYDETSNTFKEWEHKGVAFRIYSEFKGANDDSDCNGDVIDEKTTNSKMSSGS